MDLITSLQFGIGSGFIDRKMAYDILYVKEFHHDEIDIILDDRICRNVAFLHTVGSEAATILVRLLANSTIDLAEFTDRCTRLGFNAGSVNLLANAVKKGMR